MGCLAFVTTLIAIQKLTVALAMYAAMMFTAAKMVAACSSAQSIRLIGFSSASVANLETTHLNQPLTRRNGEIGSVLTRAGHNGELKTPSLLAPYNSTSQRPHSLQPSVAPICGKAINTVAIIAKTHKNRLSRQVALFKTCDSPLYS